MFHRLYLSGKLETLKEGFNALTKGEQNADG